MAISSLLLQVPAPAAQLTKVLAGLRHTFVVADATLPDCPLVYASEGCVPISPGSLAQNLQMTEHKSLLVLTQFWQATLSMCHAHE